MTQTITASYAQDAEDWTVTVAGLGKELNGRAPGIIAARDRADQLVEQLATEGPRPTVVHLLNGSALEFTSAYITARIARTDTDEVAGDGTATDEEAQDEAVAEATPDAAPTPAPAQQAKKSMKRSGGGTGKAAASKTSSKRKQSGKQAVPRKALSKTPEPESEHGDGNGTRGRKRAADRATAQEQATPTH